MKRAAIYARVSTHNGQNPEMQVNEVRACCQRRDWVVVDEYVDTGISGLKLHRPALERLLSDCRKRGIDAVAPTAMIALRAACASWSMHWKS
jgi:site-specific DNA recombinase